MRRLSKYINEAISRRGNSRRMEFPEDNTDKDGIINWLELKGFYEVENTGYGSGADLEDYYEKTGRECYILGLYEDADTSWIFIYDGAYEYFIRTVKKVNTILEPMFGITKSTKRYEPLKSITYQELRKLIMDNND